MKHPFLLFAICLVLTGTGFRHSQQWQWWDPASNAFPVLEGRAWPGQPGDPYGRLPAAAEKTVSADVWGLSHNSAGLYIKFSTNASDIVIRYTVLNSGSFAMYHMPATGVSGVDLYAIGCDGSWVWAPGLFSFGDTIEYRFTGLGADTAHPGREVEYRLFLPLYNTVTSLRIGVPEDASFRALPLSPKKPVVVYGTSIAQGACASRPGLAWTAILQRRLDRPLINLGFSGSGKLEAPVIDWINTIDARLYVLDCLPNLSASAGFTGDQVEALTARAVRTLRARHPSTPILLTEHSGGHPMRLIDTARRREFRRVNEAVESVFARLQSEGIRNIYLLKAAAIGLDINSTVDGIHPNDIGMQQYADAYDQCIRAILDERQTRH